jgi:hypothetical protein
MRTMRLMVGDRLSGGVIAVLAGVFLVLQSISGSAALTRMAAMSVDPLAVLCAPGGSGGDEAVHPLDCCATLCQTANSSAALPPPEGLALGPAAAISLDAPQGMATERFASQLRHGLKQPRAPPAFSA